MKDLNSNTITPDIPTPARLTSDNIIIRRAHIHEAFRIGAICARTYHETPLTRFLSPKSEQYYKDYERGFQIRVLQRFMDPSCLVFVAVEKSNPTLAIGQAQFQRFGTDAGYKAQLARRDTLWLRILAFIFTYFMKIYSYIFPDRSANPAALNEFIKAGDGEMKAHWNHRPNRWEARSVVVLEDFQGRGIGKMLMKEVIAMSEEEGVEVGLHASAPGRLMYQSVGFKHLAKFIWTLPGDEGGGVMLYTPKSFVKKD